VIGAGVGAGVAGAGVGAVVMAPSPESFLPFPWPPAPPFLIAAALLVCSTIPNTESFASAVFARRDTRCELNKPRIVLPRASIPSTNNMRHNAEYFILQ